MAWERRKLSGRIYYYRAERHRDGIRKVYLGRGADAQAAAQQDAEARARRRADRDAAATFVAGMQHIDQVDDRLDAVVELITEATLLANGIHQHRGQFRKRRVTHGGENSADPAVSQDSPAIK